MLYPDSRPRRTVATALLVFQAGVLGAFLPIEPGLRDARPPGAHVERADTDECAPPHDEARCQICQTVTHRVAVSPPPFFAPRTAVFACGSRPPAGQPPHASEVRLGRPRAPPPLPA